MTDTLRADHVPLTETTAMRRYFAKFDRIIGHLHDVATETTGQGRLGQLELQIIEGYLQALSSTFRVLFYKHLMAPRVPNALPHHLEIDRVESGFPVYRELLQMGNDYTQADARLSALPRADKLKAEMLDQILGERTIPTRLQFALSQRLYYQGLQGKALFWAQNDPQCVWIKNLAERRRQFLIHWAVYDSQTNLPVIYLMLVEDTGRGGLPKDERRWPRVQGHLSAQSMASLKLVTIAKGFDEDFDDLHPKFLRRIHIGPMYSHNFTKQTGPLREILEEAKSEPGLDWALSWANETLISKDVKEVSAGFFSTVEREIFDLDQIGGITNDSGATHTKRALILPQKPYQVLEDRDPPTLRRVKKYVVSPRGQVLVH